MNNSPQRTLAYICLIFFLNSFANKIWSYILPLIKSLSLLEKLFFLLLLASTDFSFVIFLLVLFLTFLILPFLIEIKTIGEYIHFAIYAPLGFFVIHDLKHRCQKVSVIFPLYLATLLLVSLEDELLQVTFFHRTGEVRDILLDLLGSCYGLTFFIYYALMRRNRDYLGFDSFYIMREKVI